MDKAKRDALAAAGWKVGTAAEFLGLSEEEQRLVQARLSLGQRIRALRQQHQLTQAELAARMQSSQSRVAKLEKAAAGVTFDLLIHGILAAGGTLSDVATAFGQPQKPAKGRQTRTSKTSPATD